MIRRIDGVPVLITINEANQRTELALSTVQVLSITHEAVDYLWAHVDLPNAPPTR